MTMLNWIGLGVGVFLVVMAYQFILKPDHHMELYFGERILTAAGRNEIRSMIGGTNLGLGCLMFAGLVMPEYQKAFNLSVGIVGMAIGLTRAACLTVDVPHTNFNKLDAVVEPIGGFLLILTTLYLSELQ